MINPEAKLKQYINNMQTRLGVFLVSGHYRSWTYLTATAAPKV